MAESYLVHHGVKGMKWGVRRYQNKDGTLTPLGEKHRKREEHREHIKEERESRKSVKSMSTEEIENKIKRLKLEADYKRLSKESTDPVKKAIVQAIGDGTKELIKPAYKYLMSAAVAGQFDHVALAETMLGGKSLLSENGKKKKNNNNNGNNK